MRCLLPGITRTLLRPRVIILLLLSIVGTYAGVWSGLDAWVIEKARLQPRWFSLVWSVPPLLAGFIAPVVIPLWFIRKKGLGDPRTQAIAAAVLAAVALNLALKILTGRVSPEAEIPVDLLERSRCFNFGLLRGGVWEGWPSGHTMMNGALTGALYGVFQRRGIRLAALGWIVWSTLAVTFGVQGEVHWMTDGVAGAVLGWGIGRGVRGIRNEKEEV